MSFRHLIPLLFLAASGFVLAQEEQEATPSETTSEATSNTTSEASTARSILYLCELQGLTRRVEIDYESADSSLPCSVNYFKDTEAPGEVNTLWSASNIDGYCEEKASGFIDRLKSWGWSCTGD